MINRRRFLQSSVAAAGGLGLLGCAASAEGSSETAAAASASMAANPLATLGVQLYTLRSLMPDGVDEVLRQVAEIGYDHVEFAGYFDHSPDEIRAMLDAHGLAAPSAHFGLQVLQEDLPGLLEAAQTIGHQYLVCPWLGADQRETIEAYREHAATFNEIGEACRAAGLGFAYHNHAFEFDPIDGTIPYDVLLEETDPELVGMELDLFWIAEAGHDALAYFERYPGRFVLSHVKDRTAEGEMTSVGTGTIDFARIFAQAEQAGMKHFIVEHDNPEDPLASIRASYDYLQTLEM